MDKTTVLQFVGGPFEGEMRSDSPIEDEVIYVESTYELTDEGAVGKRFTCLSPAAVEEMQQASMESMKGSKFMFHIYKVASKYEDEGEIRIRLSYVEKQKK